MQWDFLHCESCDVAWHSEKALLFTTTQTGLSVLWHKLSVVENVAANAS